MAKGIRGIMGIVSLALIAGALVLMFFVVLSGVVDSTPLRSTYFLQADTSKIEGARPLSQWTYFYVCGEGNKNCGSPVPALPFGYAWAGGGKGAPPALLGHHGKGTTSTFYYYMWRFGWVFWLMAILATALGFFSSLLAPCSRLASGISGFLVANALFWFTLAASLQTAVFVKARDRFQDAGMSARIGRYAMGFTWGAWAALFLATIFLFVGCGAGGSSRKEKRASTRSGVTHGTNGTNGTNGVNGTTGKSNLGFFRRQRHRSDARGSFVDTESQRRVKDEYA